MILMQTHRNLFLNQYLGRVLANAQDRRIAGFAGWLKCTRITVGHLLLRANLHPPRTQKVRERRF